MEQFGFRYCPPRKAIVAFVAGTLSLSVINMTHASPQVSPFYIGASLGYNTISNTNHQTGGVLGRLAIGAEGYQARATPALTFGIEIAAQSDNNIQLNAPLDVIGLYGPPIRATLEPTIDLLLTARMPITHDQSWGVFFKAGVAYRDLQLIYNDNAQDQVQTVAPEIHAGVTYQATHHGRLVLFYQGIYGDNANLTREEDGTHVHGIPTQQAGFLGIEYRL